MTPMRRAVRGFVDRIRGVSATTLGVITAVLVLAAVPAVFNLDRMGVMFTPGDTIKAEFEKGWPVTPYGADVKIAGVDVGTVTGIERTGHGTSVVSMEVNSDVSEKLGSTPSAHIRPTLVLSGAFYVGLAPGGSGEYDGAVIPTSRTSLPVELGGVLSAFAPSAREGMQTAIGKTDATLRRGGREQVRRLLREAPDTLEPAAAVLNAARGTRPGRDLTEIVSGLQSTADAFTQKDGQLRDIVTSLQQTTAAFAATSEPIAEATAMMPETLRVTRAGMTDLQGTLNRLTETAESFRPSARALDSLLADLDPVLARARPLLEDLRPLLVDLRPLVERLVPTTRQATAALDDVRGPVLDRLNGPITDTIMSPWSGTGVYANGGATGNRFYEETAYLIADSAQIYQYYDQNGGIARLAAGVGGPSVGGAGFPMSLEQVLEEFGMDPPGPEGDSGSGRLPDPLAELFSASDQSGAPR